MFAITTKSVTDTTNALIQAKQEEQETTESHN